MPQEKNETEKVFSRLLISISPIYLSYYRLVFLLRASKRARALASHTVAREKSPRAPSASRDHLEHLLFLLRLPRFFDPLSFAYINNCAAETCPVYTRPECKGRSSARARSLPLVRGTGNCRSLSLGPRCGSAPLYSSWIRRRHSRFAMPHRPTAASRRPHLTAGIRSLGIGSLGSRCSRPPKVEHVLSTRTYVRDRPVARDFQLRAHRIRSPDEFERSWSHW